MSIPDRIKQINSTVIAAVFVISILALFIKPCSAEVQSKAPIADEGQKTLGERIYRECILPSGKLMQSVTDGNISVPGSSYSCASCHLRGGLGASGMDFIAPAISGRRLYQPYYSGGLSELSQAEWEKVPKQFRFSIIRPAYTDETLARAIREGVDSNGRMLSSVMPHYQINDRDMSILIGYLKQLSSTPSPGVTDTTIHFATVIAGKVSDEDRAAMLIPLEKYVIDRNNQAKPIETRRKIYGWGAENMDREYRRLSLSVWELKGEPETWRAQLEEYFRKEPVFALIGGISYGDWKPVHEFSEEHRLPCLLPVTDFPVISETDWYTLYFSKGLYQEGEAAAYFIAKSAAPARNQNIVQIVQDSREARAIAAGFEASCQALEMQPPVTRIIKTGERISPELLRQLAGKDKHTIMLLWAGAEFIPSLETLSTDMNRPERVYVSSSLIKQGLMKLPPTIRDFTYITYPYRLPQEEVQYSNFAKAWLFSRKAPINDKRISTRMFSLISLMSQTFMHLKRNYYRDNLLDVIGMYTDQLMYPDYERLNFDSGQQYLSKGCYIVQLSQGDNPQLVKKSDWAIH